MLGGGLLIPPSSFCYRVQPKPTATETLTFTSSATASATLSPTTTPSPTDTPTVTATSTTPVFSQAAFTYDGDGKRVQAVIQTNYASTTTSFVGNYYEVTGSSVTKYYYAGAQRIAMRKDGTLNYLLGDHLGSTSLSTDATGNVISELRYKAWGEVRYAGGTTPTDYTYTGQYSYASDFGLIYYNARWYDPYLNHFTQPDTIVPDPANTQAWDRYAYALNNSLRYTDPTGHCPEEDAACRKNLAVLLPKPIFHSFDGGWNDPRFSTWNLLRQGSACTACHVTHDQPGDWGVPTNDELSLIQVQGWRSLDKYTIPVHLGGVGITTFYASEAIAAAELQADTQLTSGYGGQFLDPDDEVVIFASQRGSNTFKTFDPQGNSAQSLSVSGSSEEAFSAAFNRPPQPGEPYWKTTAGQIGATGRYPYLDAQGSPGHVSIYGGDPAFTSPGEFIKIWIQYFFK